MLDTVQANVLFSELIRESIMLDAVHTNVLALELITDLLREHCVTVLGKQLPSEESRVLKCCAPNVDPRRRIQAPITIVYEVKMKRCHTALQRYSITVTRAGFRNL